MKSISFMFFALLLVSNVLTGLSEKGHSGKSSEYFLTLTHNSPVAPQETLSVASQKGSICPNASVILPCHCSSDSDGLLYLDCSDIINNQELEAVFFNPFPDEEFYQFKIYQNYYFTELSANIFRNVTFEDIEIIYSNISFVSEHALRKSENRLSIIYIGYGDLTQDTFPFDKLNRFPKLTMFSLANQPRLTAIPPVTSVSLTNINFFGSSVSTISPGQCIKESKIVTSRYYNNAVKLFTAVFLMYFLSSNFKYFR